MEHIIPKAKGGQNTEENLWLSCRLYKEAKGILTEALDSETGTIALQSPNADLGRTFCLERGQDIYHWTDTNRQSHSYRVVIEQ